MTIWHFLVHFTGIDYGAPYGRWVPYNFWSGFASNLAVVGAVAGAYNKHNCHQRRCWRIGRHNVNGTPWCNRHHGEARKERDHRA